MTRRARRPGLAVGALAHIVALAACTAPRAVASQCTFNGDCAASLVCAGGFCRAQCASDRDCPDRSHCSSAGMASAMQVCIPEGSPALCLYDSDCPEPAICARDGVCRAPCNGDRDCVAFGGPSARCTAEHTCESPVTVGARDAGTPPDASDATTPPTDAAATTTTCEAVVDVVNMTPVDGGGVTVRTDTSTTPESGTLRPFCDGHMTPFVHQVAMRYRMRARAFAVVDTLQAGTPTDFDVVAAIFAAPCDASSRQLGCDDDVGGDPRAMAFSDVPLEPGQEIIAAVGGFGGAPAPLVSAGNLEVVIREADAVSLGGLCDPAGRQDRCAGGPVCVLTAPNVARCLDEVREVEDNALATPQILAGSGPTFVVRGDLGPMDEDCYRFDIAAAGASLLAEITDGVRDCRLDLANTTIALIDGLGVERAHADGDARATRCTRLDGAVAGAAHQLPAGTYIACVRHQDARDSLYNYHLSLAVLPP